MIDFNSLFNEFCEYLDGKIKWSGKKSDLTKIMFDFFKGRNQKEHIPLIEIKEYMRIDYIWRYKTPEYSSDTIALALEHEVSEKKINDILNNEVQHLIDIKAERKIGIFYPTTGDVKSLKDGIEERLKKARPLSSMSEKYLFIFVLPTTQEGVRSMLFKGFIFSWNQDNNVEIVSLKEMIIKQQFKGSKEAIE
jgi:hypothetical protein